MAGLLLSLGLVCITHVPPQLGSKCAVRCFRGLFSLAFLVPVIEITGVFVRLRLRPRQRPRQRPRSARYVTKSRRFDSSGAAGWFGRFLGAWGLGFRALFSSNTRVVYFFCLLGGGDLDFSLPLTLRRVSVKWTVTVVEV